MPEPEDIELLRAYAEQKSEQAFETLVARHLTLVYSAAMRQAGDPHLAQEIAQATFLILARKAGSLDHRAILPSWLFQTVRYVAAAERRATSRHQRREQEAAMIPSEPDPAWERIAPMLDEAIASLGERDRQAVVLRFLEQRPLNEVGRLLGIEAKAAQKRVERAVERLRGFFSKRGVTLSAVAIVSALSTTAVRAQVPAGLVSAVAAGAASAGHPSTTTITLIKGALKLMAWTKAKTAVVVGAGLLLAAGTATVTITRIARNPSYPWQVEGSQSRRIEQAPPQVAILPSKARYPSWGTGGAGKMMGTGVSAQTIVHAAYQFRSDPRTVWDAQLPPGKFDFIATLASGNPAALQNEVKRKFGIIARRESRDADVLLLTVSAPNAPGLKSPKSRNGSGSNSNKGELGFKNSPLSAVAAEAEGYLKVPVLDQTGATDAFDIDLKWDDSRGDNPDGFKQALLEQLGLDLIPARQPVEMLVVQKAK